MPVQGLPDPPRGPAYRPSVAQRRAVPVVLALNVRAEVARAPVRSPGFRMPCRERAVELAGGRGMPRELQVEGLSALHVPARSPDLPTCCAVCPPSASESGRITALTDLLSLLT